MTTVVFTAIAALAAGLAWTLLRRPSAKEQRQGPNTRVAKPRVAVVEAGADTTTAYLLEPHHPPEGWTITTNPNLWTNDPREHPDALNIVTELMGQPTRIGTTANGAALIVDQAITPTRASAPTFPTEGSLVHSSTDQTPTCSDTPTARPGAPTQKRDKHVLRLYGNVGLNDRHDNPRPRTIELLTYIAFHPGATTDNIKTGLWPNQPITPSAFNNCVAAARRALGETTSGDPHLPVAANGTYTLGEGVTTDAHELAIALAAHDLDAIRAVLANVRGMPFASPTGYHWTHEEGLDSAATETIVRAADTLARSALTNGDTTEADWAARTALLAAPGDRRLWLIRLLCAPGPAALEQVARQLVADIGELDHELADAYRSRGGQRCLT